MMGRLKSCIIRNNRPQIVITVGGLWYLMIVGYFASMYNWNPTRDRQTQCTRTASRKFSGSSHIKVTQPAIKLT